MLLILHITIALTGLLGSTFIFFRPTAAGLRATGSLVALTLLSGTLLVLTSDGHILQACISGLVYTAAASVGMIRAYLKLSAAKEQA